MALGVGERDAFRRDMYTLGMFHSVRYEAYKYVRDWRVAGALMDKLPHPINISSVDNAVWVEITIYSPNGDEEADPIRIVAHQENQPRAIIEACVDALERVLEGLSTDD